jgi:hypothetical protein
MYLDHETLRTLSRFRDLSCHQGTVRYIPSTFTIKGLSHFSASDVLLLSSSLIAAFKDQKVVK